MTRAGRWAGAVGVASRQCRGGVAWPSSCAVVVGWAVGCGVNLDVLEVAEVGSEADGALDVRLGASGKDTARDGVDDSRVTANAGNVKGPT